MAKHKRSTFKKRPPGKSSTKKGNHSPKWHMRGGTR